MSYPFFSQDWCDAAKSVANANTATYRGFKDPATFTNRMAFAPSVAKTSSHMWNGKPDKSFRGRLLSSTRLICG